MLAVAATTAVLTAESCIFNSLYIRRIIAKEKNDC